MSTQTRIGNIEPLIDAQSAARILKLHPVTVREMAHRGDIPCLRIGRVWRFRVSSLDAWVDSQLQWERHSQSPTEKK
jgi:excisionase family DNA binding protein